MYWKLLFSVALLLVCISKSSWALDAACPEDNLAYSDLQGVIIEYTKTNGKQVAANIYLQENFKKMPLYNVSLEYGDWSFTKDGDEKSVPEISTSLKIRKHNGKPFVQVFLGKTEGKTKLIIQYGELCGVLMMTELSPP